MNSRDYSKNSVFYLFNGKIGYPDYLPRNAKQDEYRSTLIVLCNTGNLLIKGQPKGSNDWVVVFKSPNPPQPSSFDC